MEEENKFYHSKLPIEKFIIPFSLIISLPIFIAKKNDIIKDDWSFLIFILFILSMVILILVFFIYWLVSLKNAKKSYIELSQKSMVINNCYWFLKTSTEFTEIKYVDIEEIKIFFVFRCLRYNVNIYRKWNIRKHSATTFELKFSDDERFLDTIKSYWVNVSMHSHFF